MDVSDQPKSSKLKLSLVPGPVIELLAKVMTLGNKKYKENTWLRKKQIIYIEAAERHIIAFKKGEIYDKESGLPHLAHATTNLIFLTHLIELNGTDKSLKPMFDRNKPHPQK